MRKTVLAVLSAVALGAGAVGLTNCGGTNSGGPDIGNTAQEVACAGGNCLDLRAPATIPTGTESRFSCRLTNASGGPQPNIQLCFSFAGGPVEPTCALTDSTGLVSASFECGDQDSHVLECRAPLGFNLEARETVLCTGGDACTSDADCQTNQFCALSGGFCGRASSLCLPPQANGSCCESDNECISDFCDEGTCAGEPICGNGVVESGEACDDGDFDDFDGCTSTCTFGPTCGNNITETGEGCDDGNRMAGDGCSSSCQLEP